MYQLPVLEVHETEGLHIVRGDLIVGGVKFLCLLPLLREDIDEEEVVYCAHAYGHSSLALGLAGQYANKKVTLFFAGAPVNTYVQDQVDTLENVTSIFLPDVTHQSQLVEKAKEYAQKNNACYLPIGFDYSPFTDRFVVLAKSLELMPEEVWVAAGSGMTARCLRKVWPKAIINTVNLGMMPDIETGSDNNFFVPEEPEIEAQLPPPYASAKYYDAKMWCFITQHASKGALVWNTA
jgi:hypothetical protein